MNQISADAKRFVFGAHFYRHPDPRPAERREVLERIAAAGFDTVRLFPAWAYCNPERGRFDFAELEAVLEDCDELALRVLLGVPLEDAPFWLEAEHPETRFVRADGQARPLGGAFNNTSAGAPGLCLDWAPIREAAASFIHAMTAMASLHPSMFAYDCWNEPHNEPVGHLMREPFDIGTQLYCYCAQTIARFRTWLEQRYSTIETLNEAWSRRYWDWSLIDAPRRRGTYADWLDWLRFLVDRATGEMRFRVEQIRISDHRSLIESHMGLQVGVEASIAILGVNPWRLAGTVETWGVSNFPGFILGPMHRGAARLELTRSQAAGRPFWMTELQGGVAGGGFSRTLRMRPRDIRVWNWMAVATGAKGILYWTYYPGTTSTESGCFALAGREGRATDRLAEASDTGELIRSHWDLIEEYRPDTDVALLFDQDSSLLTFAMTGSEDVSIMSFQGYYRALWTSDLWVDFIESSEIANIRHNILIAPWLLMASTQVCDDLRAFVERGGTLILQSGFGLHSADAALSMTVPPYGLAALFGYSEGESFHLPSKSERPTLPPGQAPGTPAVERTYLVDAELQFTEPIVETVKAHTFVTPLAVDSAAVIATFESMPVAIRKDVGRGRIYYIGTNLGASIEAGDEAGLRLVQTIVGSVVRPTVRADGVRPRLIEGGDRALLIVFNDGPRDVPAVIEIPPQYNYATDLYSGEDVPVHRQSVAVAVPSEGVSVLLLRRSAGNV